MTRTRLRSRVFAITATYAVLLVGIAFVLTWRAQVSQRDFNRLVDVDSRVIVQLEELQRTHNAFTNQWPALGADRYRVVRQLLEVAPLSTTRHPEIERAMDRLEASLRAGQPDPEAVRRNSRAVVAATENEIGTLRAEVDGKIRLLAANARNTMWVALGIAYIIAILSFAVARITLLKLVRPMEELSRAAEQIASEDFTARARVTGDLEIAQLAESFNRMAEQLAASHDVLRERARTDELTGLPNFRAFRENLEAEIERANRYQHSFGILVFDIDHFKDYNDEFGHLAGNEALKAVSETIRRTLRAVDMAARYGGEEFVAVLPEIEPEGLATLAERIRVCVAAIPPIQGDRRLTLSVGGAIFPQDGITAEELFEVADSRLYEAKAAGRNRVIVPSPLAPLPAGERGTR